MLPPKEITGVVLAGGKSSRFGSNKALSIYNETTTFLQQTIARLRPFVQEVVIAGSRPEYNDIGIPVLADKIEGIGPLGGIYTALEYSRTPWILVMTCDMPFVTDEVIAYLLATASESENITGWEPGELGGVFPLLVSKKAIPHIEKIIATGRHSVKQLFDGGPPSSKTIPIPENWRHFFENINTRDEYKNLITH